MADDLLEPDVPPEDEERLDDPDEEGHLTTTDEDAAARPVPGSPGLTPPD